MMHTKRIYSISIGIVFAVVVLVIFFYAGKSKMVEIKLGPNPSETVQNSIGGGGGDAAKAQGTLQSLDSTIKDFDALRVPSVSYKNEYEKIRQLYDARNYPETIAQSKALEATIRGAIAEENDKPKIAITFDAGAGTGATEQLLEYLTTSRLKLMFFATGKWTEQNTELFKKVLQPDDTLVNELGNHTYSHPHFISDHLTDEEIADQINKTENIFASLGFTAKPRFRYPYGEHNAHTDEVVKGLGYTIIPWTVDSLGWENKYTAQEIVGRVVTKVGPQGIVLMHVGSNEDVAALPQIIEKLKADYRFVFVSEL